MRRILITTLAFIFGPLLLFGQVSQEGAVITGTVTDAETGEPLAGANVFIDALNLGAAADAEGTYRIVVPARFARGQDVQILARFIGYRSGETSIILSPGLITQDFSLEIDVLGLDEIVVTGRGQITSKEKFGVSFSKVESEEIERSGYSNIVSAIAGKAPNVEITNTSGEPGAEAFIRVRGASSISLSISTQPLIVVDGTPISNNRVLPSTDIFYRLAGATSTNRAFDINPDDIEKIEILKGAAATAIYGSRAANGVILITTKSGVAGQTRANYRVSYSWDKVNMLPELQTKYGQGFDGDPYSGNVSVSFGPDLDTLEADGVYFDGTKYDHAKELFRTGSKLEHNFSLSGGSQDITYFLSFSSMDHTGVIKGPNNYYNRKTARIKGTYHVNQKLSITGNMSYALDDGAFVQQGSNVSGLLLGAFRTPPNFNNEEYLTPEGWHRSYRNPNPTSEAGTRLYDNPFWTIYKVRNLTEVSRTIGNLQVNWEVLPGVNVNYTLGADFAEDLRRTFMPPGNSTWPTGYIDRFVNNRMQIDHNLSVNAPFSLGPGISGTLSFGQVLNRRVNNDFGTEGHNVGTSLNQQLPNTTVYTPYEYEWAIHTASSFGNVSLDLMDQLYLNAGLNREGSTTFGKEEDAQIWALFPRGSATWVFTKMLPLPGINYGKLRLAWGRAGNQPSVYSTLSGYTNNLIIDGWVTGLNPNYAGYSGLYSHFQKAAVDIKPEISTEIEFGIDLALFNSRLGLEATYYNSETQDAIFGIPLPPSTGYAQQVKNGAVISNKGLELVLSGRLLDTKDLKWDARFLYASNKSRVLELPDAEHVGLGGFVSCTGESFAPDTLADGSVKYHPVGTLYGADFVRFGRGTVISDPDGNQVNIDEAFPGWKEDDLFIGWDGFPLQDGALHIIGDPNPDWTGSFSTDLSIGKFITVSALVDIKMGGDVWNGTKGALYFFGTHGDQVERAASWWDYDNNTGYRNTGYFWEVDANGKPVGPTIDFTDPMFYNRYDLGGEAGKPWGPGAPNGVIPDTLLVPAGEVWWASNLGSGFTGPGSQFVEDGSYIKLREVAVAFHLPNALYSGLGIRNVSLRLSARNIYTWTKYTGIDPETNISGADNLRGLDYFNNPQTLSTIATLMVDF